MEPTKQPVRTMPSPQELQKVLSMMKPENPVITRLQYLDRELERAHQTLRCAMENRIDPLYKYTEAVEELRKELNSVLAQLTPKPSEEK